MYNKSDEHFIIVQDSIESNKQEMKANNQDSDDIIMKVSEDFKPMLESDVTKMMYQINLFKPSPYQRDLSKPWTLLLWSRLIGGLYHWTVETLQNWWHVESQT